MPGWLKATVLVCTSAAVLVGFPLLLRRFVIEAFQIPSGAMLPSLLIGDHIFVRKWGSAKRGAASFP